MAYKLCAITWSHHYSFDIGKFDDMGLIDLYAKEGLGGIEFIMEHIKSFEEKHLLKLKKHATANGLAISCISPGNNFGNIKDRDNKANLDYVKKSIDTAYILGAPLVRVFAGWPPQGMRDKLWMTAVTYMKKAADYAALKGITLVVEPHNGGGFLPDSLSTEKFLKDTGHPNVKLNLDTGNYHDKDMYAALSRTIKYAEYCHVKVHTISKDGKKTSDFDLEKVFKILGSNNYRGWLSVEYEGQEFLKADNSLKSKNELEYFGVAVRRIKQLIKKYY